MASTRSFKSPGVFAENASTAIPPTPIAGVAYRDAVTGTDDTPNGWRYGTKVESQDWNQVMFMLTSMLAMQDKQGLLGWSDQVDYDAPALVFGSNGLIYIALQASGPSTAPQDPTAGLPYWSDFAMHGMVSFATPGVTEWTVPAAMRLGYIRPKITLTGGGGGNQGTIGGSSSFGAFLSASGGTPSVGATAGSGGAATGGAINIQGGNGGAIPGAGGDGGGSYWGATGAGRSATGIYGAGAGSSSSAEAGAGAGATSIEVVDLFGVESVSIVVGAAGSSTGTAAGNGIVIIEW